MTSLILGLLLAAPPSPPPPPPRMEKLTRIIASEDRRDLTPDVKLGLIDADRSVRVTVSVAGMTPTASHIYEGAAGANGPVIVPFTKISDNVFVAPEGAQLTDAQYASYKAGNLYVNVHSAKYPGGEVRAQIVGR